VGMTVPIPSTPGQEVGKGQSRGQLPAFSRHCFSSQGELRQTRQQVIAKRSVSPNMMSELEILEACPI
jgi:hypothetical protein